MTTDQLTTPTEAEEVRTQTTRQPRADYAAGLRVLADAIERNPDTPLLGSGSPLMLFAHDAAQFAAIAPFVEDAQPSYDLGTDHYQFQMDGRIRGLQVTVYARPGDVCEKSSTRMVEQHEWTYLGAPVAAAST